jgi:5-methylcytosine-specific restriction protein A
MPAVKRGSMPKRVRQEFRPGARERGYNHLWEQAAKKFRWQNPFCLGCLAVGVKRRAEVTDHIVPHKGDQTLFWAEYNWQSCCAWHHNSVKLTLEREYAQGKLMQHELRLTSARAVELTRQRYRPAVGADGFAIAGS